MSCSTFLLFSGRQFLASEPAASDTSDSDSKPIPVIYIIYIYICHPHQYYHLQWSLICSVIDDYSRSLKLLLSAYLQIAGLKTLYLPIYKLKM